MLYDSVAICGRDDEHITTRMVFVRQSPRQLSVVIVDTSSWTQTWVDSDSSYTMTCISEGYSEERLSNHGSNTTWLTIIRKTATSIGDLLKASGTPAEGYAEALSASVYRYPPRTVKSQSVLTLGPPPSISYVRKGEAPRDGAVSFH